MLAHFINIVSNLLCEIGSLAITHQRIKENVTPLNYKYI